MDYKSLSLENRLYKGISKKGELAFWLVPGATILDARKDARESPEGKKFYYAVASTIEAAKLAAYFGVAYSLYQLAERLF